MDKGIQYGTGSWALGVRDMEALPCQQQPLVSPPDGTTEFVSYCDRNLRVRWANSLCGDNLNQGDVDVVGKFCYQALQGRQTPCHDCAILRVFQTAQPVDTQTQTPDGRQWHIRGYPVRDGEGQIEGVVKIARQLATTRNNHAHLAYHVQLEKILLDLSATPAALPDTSLETRIQRALGRMGDMMAVDRCYVFEFSHAFARMHNTYEWCRDGIPSAHPNRQNLNTNHFWTVQNILMQGKVVNLPDLADLPPHENFNAPHFARLNIKSLLCVPMFASGQLHGFLGFDTVRHPRNWSQEAVGLLKAVAQALAGVLQYKHTALKLQQSEELLSIAFKASPLPASITDLDSGQLIDVNQSFLDHIGYRREEVIGNTSTQLKLWVQPKQRRDLLQKLRSAQTVKACECSIRHKSGRHITMLLSAGLMKNAQKQFMVIIAEDITQRKQAQRRAFEEQAALAHLARVASLAEMATGIAHEVNQPLAAITFFAGGCLRILEASKHPLNKRLQKGLRGICTEAHRAGDIIHTMRHFLRKENHQRLPTNLSNLVQEAASLLRHETKENNVALRFNLAHSLKILADRTQLKQVVLNLLRNAVDALLQTTPSNRIITVTTRPVKNNLIKLSVADHGPGFQHDAPSRLFDPFYTTKPNGLGMGLSLSRSIIEAHGGRLWAEHNKPSGAIFHFTLPKIIGSYDQ